MTEYVGRQLGNYRLIRLLGRGGFAEVYLGEHVHLGTQAAIKVLRAYPGRNAEALFLREARTLAQLVHPAIIRVLEGGIDDIDYNTLYLVMEYAPNGTLRARHPRGSKLALAQILSYISQLAPALDYAHEHNLIHRDVKPENLLLGRQQELLLSDFGLAITAQSANFGTTQEVAGTSIYMAPEQIQSRPCPASDQYALGVIVYEWLTGAPPFSGSFVFVVTSHLLTPPPSLCKQEPTLPAGIEQVVMQALAKEPQERFASVTQFAQAFREVCEGESDCLISLRQALPAQRLSAESARVSLQESGQENGTVASDLHAYSTILTDEPVNVQKRAGVSRRVVMAGGALGLAVLTGVGVVSWQAIRLWVQQISKPADIAHAGKSMPARQLVVYQGHKEDVTALAWSPNQQYIASTSYDNIVQIWQARTAANAWAIDATQSPGYLRSVIWLPDSEHVIYARVSTGGDNNVFIDMATRPSVTCHGHSNDVMALAWSPNRQYMASASLDKTVRVWHVASGRAVSVCRGHTSGILALAWSPDGNRIVSASDDETACVWQAQTGELLFTYREHEYTVTAVAWSPHGERIASGSGDRTVRVWDAASGERTVVYREHKNTITALAWSLDGQRIASGGGEGAFVSNDNRVLIWYATSAHTSAICQGHKAQVNAVAWSQDGRSVVSGSMDTTVRIWQVV